jgi:hypothetical protein
MLFEVCCSSSSRGLYVTVRSSSPLPLSVILSSACNWSMWPLMDWMFRDAFIMLVTCKEICSFYIYSEGGLEWCMHRDSDNDQCQLIVSLRIS